MSEGLAAAGDGFDVFFSIWSDTDVDDALQDYQRAPQARWPAVAVVLVLWYWAFMNRRLPFCQLLYRSWHLVLALAQKRATR